MAEPTVARTVELHRLLRRVLTLTMGTESSLTVAGALMYELASLAACDADSEADAVTLIDAWAATAKRQIRTFGVGHPHP